MVVVSVRFWLKFAPPSTPRKCKGAKGFGQGVQAVDLMLHSPWIPALETQPYCPSAKFPQPCPRWERESKHGRLPHAIPKTNPMAAGHNTNTCAAHCKALDVSWQRRLMRMGLWALPAEGHARAMLWERAPEHWEQRALPCSCTRANVLSHCRPLRQSRRATGGPAKCLFETCATTGGGLVPDVAVQREWVCLGSAEALGQRRADAKNTIFTFSELVGLLWAIPGDCKGAYRTLCARCAKSWLFSTAGSSVSSED